MIFFLGLFDNHSCPFTSVYWTSAEENDNMIYLGDESGKVHVVDPRIPDTFLKTIDVFERRIKKIKFNGLVLHCFFEFRLNFVRFIAGNDLLYVEIQIILRSLRQLTIIR